MNRKSFSLHTVTLTLVIILCHSVPAWAQIDRIEDFVRAGRQDAETLTRAYLEPIANGLGGGLNTGWINTASTHRPLGFDIQVRGVLALIPDADQTYNFNDLNLNNVELASGASPESPTIGGDDSVGPEVIVRDDDGDEVGRFNLPQGTGFHFVPSPMIQASLGLIKNTDLMVRYLPEVSIGDYGNVHMKGLGIKHSISQWFPGGKLLPIDISIMAAYNRIDLQANLNLDPDSDAAPDPTYTGDYDNQQVKTSIDTFTFKLLVGKSLPFIAVYGSVGYQTSTLDLALTGDYPVSASIEGVKRTTTVSDPFSYSEDGVNDFSLTGGVKFKLLFFHIFGDYTVAKYPVANAGIGFSFR